MGVFLYFDLFCLISDQYGLFLKHVSRSKNWCSELNKDFCGRCGIYGPLSQMFGFGAFTWGLRITQRKASIGFKKRRFRVQDGVWNKPEDR
jgi:hypothetical protein